MEEKKSTTFRTIMLVFFSELLYTIYNKIFLVFKKLYYFFPVYYNTNKFSAQGRKWNYGIIYQENIKPYYIFKDSEMMSLIEQRPKNSEELLKIAGFGQVKIEKYGKEILKILNYTV